jgi:hypothetical protein
MKRKTASGNGRHRRHRNREVAIRLIEIAGACIVMAIAIGTVGASASYADGQESGLLLAAPFPALPPNTPRSGDSLLDKEIAVLTRQEISPARATQAIEVQGKIARADLPNKLQAAMGNTFAGVWFEPTSARLHIGTTSSKSRRTAEEVTAQAGLSAEVAVTPVRSTMAELLATQKQWNHKLDKLFARGEVKTGLEPQRNSVSVTIGASVPPADRTALKREASVANVNVDVTVAASPQIRVIPQATECETFKRKEAFCNRSITPGVRITSGRCSDIGKVREGLEFFNGQAECEARKNGGKGKWTFTVCTAGPEAIPLANRGSTVLLTAGHCIVEKPENWLAKEIASASAEKAIGPVEGAVFGGAAKAEEGDYASILVEPAWQTGKPNQPVFAVTAEWLEMNKRGEKTSYPVRGERTPVEHNLNCHEGQTSGEWCGEITMLDVTVPYPGKNHIVGGLIEDVGEALNSEPGDSGGPWLFVETNHEALIEGLHSGAVAACVHVARQKGAQYYPTQTECFEELGGGEGEWERENYECKEVAKVEKGPKFYPSQAACEVRFEAGEGKWQRTPELHVVYQPLRQPIESAPEGPLERFKLELLTTANEVRPLPTLLDASKSSVKEETFKGTSGVTKLGVLGRRDVECKKDKNEGFLKQVEVLKNAFGYLGLVHINFEECTAEEFGVKATCTGLGDSTSTILMLSEIHLVYDSLSPLGAAILFLVPLTHFECVAGPFKKLILVEGQALCLITPLALTKKFEIKCEAKSLGGPGEITYWNDEGKAVNIESGLLISESDAKPNEMSSLSGTETIETETLEVEIMD